MKILDQMPRRAIGWLVACQFVVVLPHLSRVPLWVLAVYVAAALWRVQMYRARLDMPHRWLRFFLGIGGALAVVASYRTLIGLEPMVALLLVATALKLLESVRAKDGYVLVSLGFFICITEFLFSQTLPVVLYTVISTVLLVTSLITLNQRPGARFTRRDPLLAAKMLGLAIPMMVVLFLLFPRIGPLWSVPSKTGEGTTGMSDFLRPGDVSKLGRSADVAFRVQFVGEIPPKPALYWRGMVLNTFRNGGWQTLGWRDHPSDERRLDPPQTRGDPLQYQVILEPTQQRWLYALPYAVSPTSGVIEAWDYRLLVMNPLESQFGYFVESWPGTTIQPQLSSWRREHELFLPAGLNPETRRWIDGQLAMGVEPGNLIANVLNFFRQEPFFYTLEPPPIQDRNFVDAFAFGTRRGFCEHYAYAFVVMMRMAGIPARIVGGYQGGEVNPLNNTVVVRQFDAHAWTEVWLEGRGWVRVDPTAAVSPARVEFGLQDALSEEEGFLADSPFSAYRFREVGIVNWMRLRYEAIAWQWQSFIVGFNSDKQLDFLKGWFGDIRESWFVAAMLGSWALVLVPLTLWLNFQRRSPPRLAPEVAFLKVAQKLEKRGVGRKIGESPNTLLSSARERLGADDPMVQELRGVCRELYQT